MLCVCHQIGLYMDFFPKNKMFFTILSIIMYICFSEEIIYLQQKCEESEENLNCSPCGCAWSLALPCQAFEYGQKIDG